MAQAEIWYRARTVEQSGCFGKTPFSTWIHKSLMRSVPNSEIPCPGVTSERTGWPVPLTTKENPHTLIKSLTLSDFGAGKSISTNEQSAQCDFHP